MARRSKSIIIGINLLLLALLIPIALFWGEANSTIITEIRVPRVATALLAGITLALAGALTQGIFINPIVEPSLLGLSSSAALGAVVGVLIGVAEVGSISTVPFAILGALMGALTILWLSNGRSALILILNGIAMTAISTALVGAAIALLDRNDIRSFTFWSFGSLALADWSAFITIGISLLIALPLIFFITSGLDLLSLGEATTRHIGVNLNRLRTLTFMAITVLVAATVSSIGSIAFLGLASTHIARVLIGPRNRSLLPTASLISANIILFADTLARRVFFPQELPIGFVIALIAAPILIWALRSQRVWQER